MGVPSEQRHLSEYLTDALASWDHSQLLHNNCNGIFHSYFNNHVSQSTENTSSCMVSFNIDMQTTVWLEMMHH